MSEECTFCVKYMYESDPRVNELRALSRIMQSAFFLCRVPKNLLDIYCGLKITQSIFIQYTCNVHRCILVL